MPPYRKSDMDRYSRMLFNAETIYRSDYVPVPFKKPPEPVTVPPRPKTPRKPAELLKDTQTITPYKHYLPFDVFWTPKDILRTNPRQVQRPYKNPETEQARERARRTRPRLVMTPAISMDDIEDAKRRDELVQDFYLSASRRSQMDALKDSGNRVLAPFPGLPAPATPIYINQLKVPYVSPEWRMDSIPWDSKQLRCHTEPDKEFWMRHGSRDKCRMCEQTEAIGNYRKMGLLP